MCSWNSNKASLAKADFYDLPPNIHREMFSHLRVQIDLEILKFGIFGHVFSLKSEDSAQHPCLSEIRLERTWIKSKQSKHNFSQDSAL